MKGTGLHLLTPVLEDPLPLSPVAWDVFIHYLAAVSLAAVRLQGLGELRAHLQIQAS